MRYLLVTVGAVLVILVGSAAALIAVLDDDDYRRITAYVVERLTGRTLTVDGSFTFDLSLEPTLAVSNMRVSNPSWAMKPDLARIGRLEIQLALTPLLSGTLLIPRLVLEDADFDLETGADGLRNWTTAADGAGAGDDGDDGFLVPVLGTVMLRNVVGRYRDATTGRDSSIELDHLTIEEVGGVGRLDGAGLWDGQKISTKGEFGTLTEALHPTKPFPLDLAISLPGLELALQGTIAEPTKGRGLDLHFKASSPTTAAFAQPFGFSLPELGAVTARAQLSGDLEQLDLKQVDLRAGTGEHAMQLTGEIDNVLLRGEKPASATVDGAVTPWLNGVLGRQLPELGHIHAAAQLTDVAGDRRLRQVQIVADDTDVLSLKVTSAEDQVADHGWGALNIDLAAKDLTILGDLLDLSIPALGPFSYSGRLAGEPEAPRLSGTARLGQTEVKGDVTASFTGARPHLSGKLSTPVLHLADLGIRPGGPWQNGNVEAGASSAPDNGPVTLPFAALRALDLSLGIQFDQIEGVGMSIDRGTIAIALEDGSLRLHPLRFDYVGGSFSIDATVNARAYPAEVAVDVIGNNVLLQEVFAQIDKTVPLDGELDLQLNLKSVGDTVPKLVSTLDGTIDIAISRGRIHNRYFDLLGTNLIHWLMVGKGTKPGTDIRCFIGQFEVDAGDSRIKALLLETTTTISKGSGDIDLANETLDIKIRPHSLSSRLMLTTPYRVEGPWSDPTVDYSKLRLAARAVEELALAPIHTLETLVPILSDGGKDPDNPCLDWTPSPVAGAAPTTQSVSSTATGPGVAGFAIEATSPTPYIALTDTHVREGPGTTYSLIETVAAGATLEVTGKLHGLNWYRMTIASGEVGYVWGKLIRPAG